MTVILVSRLMSYWVSEWGALAVNAASDLDSLGHMLAWLSLALAVSSTANRMIVSVSCVLCIHECSMTVIVLMVGGCDVRYMMRWWTASVQQSTCHSWRRLISAVAFWMPSALSASTWLARCVRRSQRSCWLGLLPAFSPSSVSLLVFI